jgi:hypothetical protein
MLDFLLVFSAQLLYCLPFLGFFSFGNFDAKEIISMCIYSLQSFCELFLILLLIRPDYTVIILKNIQHIFSSYQGSQKSITIRTEL